MGGEELGVRRYAIPPNDRVTRHSDSTRAAIERAIKTVLEEQRARCRQIIEEHKGEIIALRDLLLEKKVLDRGAFAHIGPSAAKEGTKHG